jgi:hypothetical protein
MNHVRTPTALFGIWMTLVTIAACSPVTDATDAPVPTRPVPVVTEVQVPAAAGPPIALPPGGTLTRIAGRTFLERGETEQEGYGLYSYVLFRSPTTAGDWERQRAVIGSLLRIVASIETQSSLLRLSDAEINATFIPLLPGTREGIDARLGERHGEPFARLTDEEQTMVIDMVLGNYDYGTAFRHLREISHRTGIARLSYGPYVFSMRTPLSAPSDAGEAYFFQDMSHVPAHLTDMWIRYFQDVTSREGFQEGRFERIEIELRTRLALVAAGVPAAIRAVSCLQSANLSDCLQVGTAVASSSP